MGSGVFDILVNSINTRMVGNILMLLGCLFALGVGVYGLITGRGKMRNGTPLSPVTVRILAVVVLIAGTLTLWRVIQRW